MGSRHEPEGGREWGIAMERQKASSSGGASFRVVMGMGDERKGEKANRCEAVILPESSRGRSSHLGRKQDGERAWSFQARVVMDKECRSFSSSWEQKGN